MKYLLKNHWKITEKNGINVFADAPCSVISALLDNKIIEDPYYRLNEAKVQSYLEQDYTFETTFNLKPEDLERKNYLVFERLCTIAEIFVNNQKIADVSDMQRRYFFALDNKILKSENVLRIEFKSSINYVKNYPNKEKLFESYAVTDKKSPVIRQANYMFGWDWGPHIPDMGIMGDAFLLSTTDGYLKSFRHNYEFDNSGKVKVNIDLDLEDVSNSEVEVSLSGHGYECKKTCKNSVFFEISNPKLWNPVGFGEPNLYDLKIVIKGKEVQKYNYQIGIRNIRIDDSKDEIGRNFAIYVNDKKVFLKGACYIPEDNIIPYSTKERTERLIKLAKDFNHNCIRVWGGGYYPNDDFYETCDRLGILVFQDLMFACASYNVDDPLFRNNIIEETRDTLKRIRHHASILLIAGNNEVEDGVRGHGYKQTVQYIEMFHHLLKDIVKDETDFYYLSSSPTSGEPYFSSPNDPNYLDTHYWWVWGADREIEDYLNIKPRLLSEFGMQSFPTFDTIKKFANESDMSLDSEVMLSHQKDPAKSNEKMMRYVRREFNVNEKNMQEIAYFSMLMQAEAMKLCAENLRGNKDHCNGSLYWQLNDCWPCQSLSSIDYYYGLKALHYYSKRFYNPHLVLFKKVNNGVKLCISNDTEFDHEYILKYSVIDHEFTTLDPKELNTKIGKYESADIIDINLKDSDYGLVACLYDKKGKLLSSNIYRSKKDKEFKYPKANIKLNQINDCELEISSDKFARAVYLNPHDNDVVFSDNYFNLLANTTIHISSSKPIKIEEIEIECVNNY